MVLSGKAAMAVCLSCIGGMMWMLYGRDVPALEIATPLTTVDVPAKVALGQMTMDEWLPPAADEDWRHAAADAFAEPSPVATSLEEPDDAMALAVAEPIAVGSPDEPLMRMLPGPRPDPADLALAVSDDDELLSEPMPEINETVRIGALEEDARRMQAASAEPPTLAEYRVRRGDSLARIARREYGVQDREVIELLMGLNPRVQSRGGQINIGETIVLPEADAVIAWLDSGERASVFKLAADTGPAPRWYTVRENDTLAKIAARYLDDSERWPEILELNKQLKPHKIFPGMRIKLPPAMRMAQS
jgi:nucleoid-associated protein YgaU